MLTDVGAVRNYFAKLGLEQEIADVYLSLYANGPQNISALSRSSGIERTRIYRLIDKLLDSNLIELEMQSKRGLIKAAPITNLRILINKRSEELKNLTDELELMEQIMARNNLSHGSTRVQFFVGAEGLRQLLAQEYTASSEITSYELPDLATAVSEKFMENHLAELQKRRITRRLVALPTDSKHSCHIYDDRISYFFTEGELYGLQIRDSNLAATTGQLLSSQPTL